MAAKALREYLRCTNRKVESQPLTSSQRELDNDTWRHRYCLKLRVYGTLHCPLLIQSVLARLHFQFFWYSIVSEDISLVRRNRKARSDNCPGLLFLRLAAHYYPIAKLCPYPRLALSEAGGGPSARASFDTIRSAQSVCGSVTSPKPPRSITFSGWKKAAPTPMPICKAFAMTVTRARLRRRMARVLAAATLMACPSIRSTRGHADALAAAGAHSPGMASGGIV